MEYRTPLSALLLNVCLFTLTETCEDVTKFNRGPGYLDLMNSPSLKAWGRQQLRVVFHMERQEGDRVRVIQDSPKREVIFESLVLDHDYIDTNRTNNKDYKYSAEYLRSDGTVVVRTQLADWSGWMYCLHDILGKRSVGKVLFPGTHNSGSYKVPKAYHTISPLTLVNKYIFTQDESVEMQLERGARYFDLRIGHYPNKMPIALSSEIWWINHDFVKIRPLRKIVNQIKSFLSRWPNEIIMLDLHRFPAGFKESTHDELAKFLIDQFGPLLHHPKDNNGPWSVTFNELWASPARILLSYNKGEISRKYNFYPGIRQIWADTDDQDKLNDYLDSYIPRSCSDYRMTAAMAQLTPNAAGIIKEQYGGLRGLAHDVNANITLGFAKGHWGQTAQAVAVDYLSSTGIISAAILQNVERTNPQHICN